MKKIALAVFVMFAFVGAAFAQTADMTSRELTAAAAKMLKLEQAQRAKDVNVDDVEAIQLRAIVKKSGEGLRDHRAGESSTAIIKSTDAEFAAVLAALKAAGSRSVTSETAAVNALGFSLKSEAPADVEK